MSSLEGRTVLVTGGTGSVGESLVVRLAREGCRVTFLYHSSTRRARRLARVTGATALELDLRKDCELTVRKFDILINSAGINENAELTRDLPRAGWDRTIAVNLTAPFMVIQQCLPYMMRRRWGRIINISSIYGLRAVGTNVAYTVSKHGLSGLTKTVAREYGRYGITCNEICPGPVRSRMLRRVCEERAAQDGVSLKEYMADVKEEVPTGRLVEPSAIAQMAVVLMGDSSGSTNGASFVVDGGMIV